MKIAPQAAGFILFCASRKKDLPYLYDEMCRVAGEGLYQGLRYRDLRKLGISFSLSGWPRTVEMIESVTQSRIQ